MPTFVENWEDEVASRNYPFLATAPMVGSTSEGNTKPLPTNFILDTILSIEGTNTATYLRSIEVKADNVVVSVASLSGLYTATIYNAGTVDILSETNFTSGCFIIGDGFSEVLTWDIGTYNFSRQHNFTPRVFNQVVDSTLKQIDIGDTHFAGDIKVVLSNGLSVNLGSYTAEFEILGNIHKERDALYSSLPVDTYLGVAAKTINGYSYNSTYNIEFVPHVNPLPRLLVVPRDSETLEIVDIYRVGSDASIS